MSFVSKVFLVLVLFFFSCQRGDVTTFSKYKNHNDTVKYVGMQECRKCHVEIYDSYIKTGMGKSFNYAIKEHSALCNSKMEVVYDSVLNLNYLPFWKNDSLYLLEFRLLNLDTVHKLIRKIHYKIGSGNHTNSHLYQINGFIHQAPYTFYTQDSIFDLPPGYENGNNSRFNRKIGIECMSCHNAHSDFEETSLNNYSSVPQGIDCERCHGPGEVHVKEKLAGIIIDTSKYIDYSIVNPAKLPIDLQFDVCQRCHLQGTTVLHENKSFSDFKPGMKLNDFLDVYLPKFENDHSFIMASHVERLKESACFKNSEMTCITCHNPHYSVSSLRDNYFDNKCQDCHHICKDEKIDNCVSCHMPSSSSSDIMHVTITDHKIGLHLSKDTVKGNFLGLFSINNSHSTKLSKAKAYLKRYESFESNPIYLDSALYYLEKTKDNFNDYIQYYYLSNKDKLLIEYTLNHFLDTLKYNNSSLALSFSRIGEVFSKNEINSAENYFKLSIKLMPLVLEYKIKYATFLIKNNKLSTARIILNQVIDLNPTIKEAHLNLGYIDYLINKYEAAELRLKQAIALDPDYILAYENLYLISKIQNDFINMNIYKNKILDIDPNHVLK